MTDRAAWKCPGCGRWNAPHVDRCDCQPGATESAPSPQEDAPTFDLKKFHELMDIIHPPSKPWDIDRFPLYWERPRRLDIPSWPRPYVGDPPGWLTPMDSAGNITLCS